MRIIDCFFPLLFAGAMQAQDTLSGVVNMYARVQQVEPCEARLQIADATGTFEPGQKVLLFQHTGATIDESNSAAFGDILALNSTGLFEENEILQVNGDEVRLRYTLVYTYNTEAAVQLVSFPVYEGHLFLNGVTGQAWNGATGGVVALDIAGTAELLGHLSADGLGFGDALRSEVVSNCTFLTLANNYHYSATNWRGAPKGEGVAAFIPEKENGRGPQANGGGGGNDHNSGGGGGAHIGAGGQGGRQSPPGTFGCYGNFPGLGGKALPTDSLRLFFGGEGGNGHVDDQNAGSAGARGGGIVLLRTDLLIGNGYTISARGQSPLLAQGDGAGGGGSGGTVYVQAAQLSGPVALAAAGGDGGNVTNPSDRCFGPGGGGGGGRILHNLLGMLTTAVTGGQPGQNSTPSSMCNTLSNDATAGTEGIVQPLIPVPGSTVEVQSTAVIAQPQPASVCTGDTAVFFIQVEGNFLQYQWQSNDGSGWQALPGATAPLLLFPAQGTDDGRQFRCIISGVCTVAFPSDAATLSVQAAPMAAFEATSLGNGAFNFANNSANATQYHWLFGDGTTGSDPSPAHTYPTFGNYNVLLIASNDCGSDTTSLAVVYQPVPVAAFSAHPGAGCTPLTVVFENLSQGDNLSYSWTFEGGDPPVSQDAGPQVVYASPGQYAVALIVGNAFGQDTFSLSVPIEVFDIPSVDFTYTTDSLTVSFANLSAGGSNFLWDFGDGQTSTGENPEHTYASAGTYDVTLSVTNGPCGSALLKTLSMGATATTDTRRIPGLRLFPVPTSGRLTLERLPGTPAGPIHLALYQMQGIRVAAWILEGDKEEVNLHYLPEGRYVLRACHAGSCGRFLVVLIR